MSRIASSQQFRFRLLVPFLAVKTKLILLHSSRASAVLPSSWCVFKCFEVVFHCCTFYASVLASCSDTFYSMNYVKYIKIWFTQFCLCSTILQLHWINSVLCIPLQILKFNFWVFYFLIFFLPQRTAVTTIYQHRESHYFVKFYQRFFLLFPFHFFFSEYHMYCQTYLTSVTHRYLF